MTEHVPALHKISEDSFKDTLLEYLKKDPYIIVFAEHTLSPEDFAQRDQNGEIAFPNIFSLKKPRTYVTYKPYVQNPIGAIKQLDKKVTELSIGSLLNGPNVPKNNILVIDLNDAKDDEQRFHMLKRHDSDVVSIYKDILERHDNVLAIYTSHHTSWVAPEEVTRKKSRSLLADDDTKTSSVFADGRITMYLNDDGLYVNKTTNFKFSISNGYWYINSITVQESEEPIDLKISDMYAPVRFSYHCGDLKLSHSQGSQILSLPGFQIQLFENDTHAHNITFGDAYDCVGFTSVPIWSSLFVTAILLIIITLGLTMMMDIRTMDRFDDAKGKTITINASE
ncbi:uncharacterized protein BDFB_008836 [Asbolus verrucosus]|uniref:V-type proton ATPase subunit S1 n=1 Tax=Asbolus verrucosus TaxID=1661398 RepID=A0A482WD61_ASBVE|nr:uncharacterized protein BDFB_008836 [Asbolus verrucosus]